MRSGPGEMMRPVDWPIRLLPGRIQQARASVVGQVRRRTRPGPISAPVRPAPLRTPAAPASSRLPGSQGGTGSLTDWLGGDLYGWWRHFGHSSQPRLGFEPFEDRSGFLADLGCLLGLPFVPKPFRLLGQRRRAPERHAEFPEHPRGRLEHRLGEVALAIMDCQPDPRRASTPREAWGDLARAQAMSRPGSSPILNRAIPSWYFSSDSPYRSRRCSDSARFTYARSAAEDRS